MSGMDALDAIDFAPCASVPPLADDEIHVWFLASGDPDPRAVAAFARAALEQRLCAYAGCVDAPLIARAARGKPFAPQLPELHFNLSHAGHHVLLAFARAQPLGIDLERQDRRASFDGIARRFFAAAEAEALERMPPALRPSAFLRLWTNKEAVLKALGEGLGFGLERIEFDLDETGRVGRPRRLPHACGRPDEWTLQRLEPAHGLVGALAWRGPARRIRAFTGPAAARRSAALQRP